MPYPYRVMQRLAVEQELRRSRRRRTLPSPASRRALREWAGLSQGTVARLLGVTPSAVCRWESGRRTPRGMVHEDYARLLARFAEEMK
jgi:DNA-binding transcriptional regulator YiaG